MESLPLPIADLIVIIILIIGGFNGFRKGFVVSIASLIAIIAGGMGAFFFSDCLGVWLSSVVDWSSGQIAVAAFALTFILVVLAVHLMAKALEKFLKLVALGLVNKIAGGVFGLLKNALIISFIMYGLSGFEGLLPDDLGEDCILYPQVESMAPAVLPYWEDIQEKTKLEELEDKLDEKVEAEEDKIEELGTKLSK